MFKKTSTANSPWVIINSNIKMIARLNAMRYVLSNIKYSGKKILKPQDWNKEDPDYEIILDNILFQNLNKEQYDYLYKIKSNVG